MDGVAVAINLPVSFPAGPTPLASAIPSVAAGAAATVNSILFVFNIYGVSSATLASAAGRNALSTALAAAIMVGPNLVANSGSSTGAVSTGRAFDMTTIISTPLAPVTLALTSSGGSTVFYPTSRRLLGEAAAAEEAGARGLQAAAAPIEWHVSVVFATPQVAYQVGQLLITNVIQWGTLLATELSTVNPTDFPAGTVQTSLAQPIMYPQVPRKRDARARLPHVERTPLTPDHAPLAPQARPVLLALALGLTLEGLLRRGPARRQERRHGGGQRQRRLSGACRSRRSAGWLCRVVLLL